MWTQRQTDGRTERAKLKGAFLKRLVAKAHEKHAGFKIMLRKQVGKGSYKFRNADGRSIFE
jgi:hypothetical protein